MGAQAFVVPAPKFGRTRYVTTSVPNPPTLDTCIHSSTDPPTTQPKNQNSGVARMSFEDEAGVTAPLGYWVSGCCGVAVGSSPSSSLAPDTLHSPPPLHNHTNRTPLASRRTATSKSSIATAPLRSSTAEWPCLPCSTPWWVFDCVFFFFFSSCATHTHGHLCHPRTPPLTHPSPPKKPYRSPASA